MCTGSIGENDIVAVNCGLLCCCMVVLTVCVCVCVCGIPTSSSVEWGFCVVGGWLVCCLMCSWIIGGSLIKRHCCCKMWFALLLYGGAHYVCVESPLPAVWKWGFCVVGGWLVCCSWIIGGSLIKRHCCCKMWFALLLYGGAHCVCVESPLPAVWKWGFCVVGGWLVCCSWIIGGSLIKRHCNSIMWLASC